MITELLLRNFKCFEDRRFPVRPLTILAGANGTGKSTLLQALLLLRQSHQQGLLPQKGLALNGDLVHVGSAQDALFEGAREERIVFGIELADGGGASWTFAYKTGADVLSVSDRSGSEKIYAASLFGHDFIYLSAERLGPQAAFDMADDAVRNRRQLGSRGEYTAHFLSVYGNEVVSSEVLMHAEAASANLRSQVEAWLGEVSPGVRLSVRPVRDMDLVQLQYSFVEGADVSNAYRPTNVGFGLTYTLPIVVGALAARPGALLLIENPEAHLHPRGQVRIADLLARAAKAGVQVLIETHSDHILNGIRLAVYEDRLTARDVQLHFFERRIAAKRAYYGIVSPEMDADGRIDPWPEGFFDEWDRALEALLTPRTEPA